MVDARLCQRAALGTWGVSADRDHSPIELPLWLRLWSLAMPGAWFADCSAAASGGWQICNCRELVKLGHRKVRQQVLQLSRS